MATTKKVVLNVLGTENNDTLKSTGAVEMLDGGAGIDKLTFEEGTRGVNVNLKSGKVTDSFNNKETVAGFEIVVGTSFADKIVGSDNTDYLDGGAGNDSLYGGNGADELYGATGDDLLSGGNGNDYLVGSRGNDKLEGGAGYDTADYSDEAGAGITVDMTAGTVIDNYGDIDMLKSIERVRATDFADTMIGSSAANTFEAGAGNDTLDGLGGNDVLLAGFGDDKVLGGTGNDVLVGGRGADYLDGGTGTDTVDYSQDAGWHGVSVNLATGLAEDSWGDLDTLVSVERVTGTEFADWFLGNKSKNTLNGGAGDDTLAGGGGNDTFVFQAGHGHDVINDFNAGDVLDLAALGFTSVDQVVAAASGHDLGVVITTGEGSSVVLVDVNVTSVATLGYLFA
jgi:Ca2+-binding RTX toxin-like protein